MKILYLGDIVGEATIDVLAKAIEDIKKEYKINMVLANAENVTQGKGLSQKHYKQLKTIGITAMTMGNFRWNDFPGFGLSSLTESEQAPV